ncbi:MAG: acyltransferase, partial [Saprospiraceae bacterium]|nr:acyltransferase [Saprospiraceae bacterium]
MKGRIEFIDFARGYAIFTIVCYHASQRVELSPLWQKAAVFGGTGVHLFFLLSGFGLALSGSTIHFLSFYRRRLTKVWLPYVLALSISVAAAARGHLFPDGFDAWLAGVGLYQMFSERYIESFGGHFWFVSAILQFYIVFPGLLWLKKRLGDRVFLCLALLLSAAWWLLVFFLGKGHLRVWNSFFLQFLWEFALGIVLAGRYQTSGHFFRPAAQKWWWLSLPAGLFFTGIMILLVAQWGDAGRIFNDVPALAGYTALCFFVYQCATRFFSPVQRFFLWIGG